MLMTELNDKEEVSSLVIKELREIGIKYRNEKKTNKFQNTNVSKKVFHTSLHRLELTDVILANGKVVQIPKFVSQCCQRLSDQITTEGIFRKTGNIKRQKEMKIEIEKGVPFNKQKYHTYDVAGVLKSFFRELPEPIISSASLQETLIYCLLCETQELTVESLLMATLLLPPLSLNTLAYFLQFLKTVAKHSNQNRMTVSNLALLWSENLMPVPISSNHQRLSSHHKVIELLIENSSQIGIVPDRLLKKLEDTPTTPNQTHMTNLTVTDKKKKKRRSGSLTRVFNGFKKIVGAIGSSESLDKSRDFPIHDENLTTPCITKSSKKRKITENLASFSAKKKKDVLSILPENNMLPKTPHQKEFKKARLSLGGRKFGASRQQDKSISNGEPSERRWSIVGTSWNRKKQVSSKKPKDKLSPVKSLPCLIDSTTEITESEESREKPEKMEVTDDEEYVKIPKSEYESFKERVSAIELSIQSEFNSIKLDSIKAENPSDAEDSLLLNGPEKVINKFNRTLQEVESIGNHNSTDDQLAKHMSKGLKIRRSVDSKIMRSPSARKIGSIRRRSKEGVRLSRNQSWHLGATSGVLEESKSTNFYPKSNLRRGRPNTVQTGLRPVPPPNTTTISIPIPEPTVVSKVENETWTSADTFFSDPSNDHHDLSMEAEKTNDNVDDTIFKTPNARMKSLSIRSTQKFEVKTPMLPPALPPRRTPSTATKQSPIVFSKTPSRILDIAAMNKILTPAQDHSQGRASIARIRSQNAGMVMQKAKLFDGMVEQKSSKVQLKPDSKLFITRVDFQISKSRNTPPIPECQEFVHKPIIVNKTLENVKKSDVTPQKSPKRKVPLHKQSVKSPRSPRSPASGVNRRQKLRANNSPHSLKTDKANRIDNNENRFRNKLTLLDKEVLEEISSPSKIAIANRKQNFPPIRKPLTAQNSPRRIIKTPVKSPANNKRTPLKAGHGYGNFNARQSPRLSTVNRKSLKSTY